MVLLAAAGAISAIMIVILAGIEAFKIVSLAMLDFAPELAAAASKVPIGPVLKALIILAEMAVAVVLVLAQMVLLAGAGILAALMIPILIGIEAFKYISMKMIEFAPVLGEVAKNVNASLVAKALLVLGMMAVSIAENVVIMLGLTAIGLLALLAPIIVIGMAAFIIISAAMLGAAKKFDEVAAGINGQNVLKALAILAAMSIAIAQAMINIVLLAGLGVLTLLAPLIILGAVAFGLVTVGLMETAKFLDEAKSKINGDNVIKALGVLGLMSIAIAQALISVLMLVALGALLLLWPVVKAGMIHFEWLIELMTEKMPGIVENINKLAAMGLSSSSGPIDTLGAISKVMSTTADLVKPMVLLAILKSLGVDIDGGMTVLVEIVTKMTDKAIDVINAISKVPSSGMETKVKAFADILAAIGNLSNSIASGIKSLDFGWFTSAKDKTKMMGQFNEILKTMMDGLIGIITIVIAGISKISASKETLEGAKTMAEILGAVGKLAEGMKPPPGLFEAAKEAYDSTGFMEKALAGLNNHARVVGEQIGTMITTIAEKLLPAVEKFKGTNPESLKALAVVIESVGKVAEAFKPPPGLMDAIKDMDPISMATAFDGLSKFFETAGPVINSAIAQISKEVPPLINAIAATPMSPAQIDTIKVIGPIIGALAGVIGALIAPAVAFMNAKTSGGFFDNPPSFGEKMTQFTKVLDVMQDSLEKVVGPDGPMKKLIDAIAGMDPAGVEKAGKVGPLIAAIAAVVGAIMPKGDVLKAIEDAAKDEDKFKLIMEGIEKVSGTISTGVGKMLVPVGELIKSISGFTITPEQIKILEVLMPLIQSVVGMTSGIVGSLKDGKVPDDDGIARIKQFFEATAAGMTKMFEVMNAQVGKLIGIVVDLVNTLKKQNIKPSEVKEGADVLKTAFDMIAEMGKVTEGIKAQMGGEPGKPPDPKPWEAALTGLSGLIEGVFGKDGTSGPAANIVKLLSSDSIKKMGENKDGIAALMSAFDFISKLPGTIKALKESSGGEGGQIEPSVISGQVTKISEIFEQSLTKDNIDKISNGMKALAPLGAQKEKISLATEAFKNTGALAVELAQFAKKPEVAGLDSTALLKGVTNVDTALSSIKTKAPSIGTSLAAIKTVSDASGLATFSSTISNVVSNANTIKSSIDSLDTAFKDLADPGKSLASLKTAITGFSGAALTNSFKELQKIASAVKTLDDSLAAIGKIDIKQRIAQVAGGAGLDGGGVYTVKSKDVNINIQLTVTMEAGGVEKVILQNNTSAIKKAINMTADGLGKSGDDAAGNKNDVKNLMNTFGPSY